MREILFRGKRVDNGEWVYGYFVKSDGPINNGKCFILPTVADFSYGDNGNRIRIGCFAEVDSDTVGQYTGLIDKNETRLYEKDIVNCKTKSYLFEGYTIEWYNDDARFVMVKNGRRYAVSESFEYEIVGNIIDNPDMLTDK